MRIRLNMPARGRLIVTVLALALLALVGVLNSGPSTVAGVGTTTAIVGISKTPTTTPTDTDIDTAVREAVALAGGLPDFDATKKIVIHPNLVEAGWTPNNGVTTNVQVVKTLVDMCVEAGAVRSNITICEGSAGFHGSRGSYTARQMTWKSFSDYGYSAIPGVNFVDANDCGTGSIYPNYPGYSGPYSTANHVYYYKYSPPGGGTPAVQNTNLFIDRVYALPKCVVDCDYMITVPCLKNHDTAGITGGLKLAFGLAPADVFHYFDPNVFLGKWNLLHQDSWGLGELQTNAQGMVDLTMLRPPDLVVIDGLVGIYTGPTREPLGQANPPMSCIIASTDVVAADTVGCLAMGYRVDSIASLTRAAEKNLGTNNPGRIEIRGYHVKDIRRWFGDYHGAIAGDQNPPTITTFSLADNAHVCGQLSAYPIVYSDPNPGVCKAELFVDGVLVDSVDSAPYLASWLPTNQSEGAHTITYTLYDKMLNEKSLSRTVYLHKGDPLISALGLDNGSNVSLGTVVFMGRTPSIDSNTFFVCSTDGLRGLRVRFSSAAPNLTIGQRIGIYGSLASTGGQRYLSCGQYTLYDVVNAPKPRYFRNKAIGGAALNAVTPGVTNHYGPYNLGCLVRTSGKVLSNGSGYFIISDGSIRAETDGVDGIKIRCGSISQPAVGETVKVTGFSCSENDGGTIRPMVAVRNSADID